MRNGGIIGDLNIPRTRSTKGVYTLTEAHDYIKRGIWPLWPTDASYASVVALCHCRTQLDDPASYPNEATGGDVIVPNGSNNSQQLVTTQSKWYTTSFKLATSYLRIGSTPGINFGTGDFTMELWLYPTNVAFGNADIIDCRNAEPNLLPLWYCDNTGRMHLYVNGVDNKIQTATGVVTNNSWHFLALSRVSGSTRMYCNGTQVGSTYVDANNYITGGLSVGASFNGNSPFQGFLGGFRVTKGVGRYSGTTHTVPTGPFPDTA